MNKSKFLIAPAALMMAGMLVFSGCGKSTQVVQTEPSSEAPVQTVRMIGEASEDAFSVNLTNGTDKKIIALSVLSDEDSGELTENPVNLLENDAPIDIDEQVNLLYAPAVRALVDDEELSGSGTSGDSGLRDDDVKEATAEYTIRFTTDDDEVYNLHAFPFEDLEEGLILLSVDDVAYLEYTSISTGSWVNTLDAEIETAELLAEQEEAAKAEEEAAKKTAEEAEKAAADKSAQNNNTTTNKKKSTSGSGTSNTGSTGIPGVVDDDDVGTSGGDTSSDTGSDAGGSSGDSGSADDGGDDGCLEDGLTW